MLAARPQDKTGLWTDAHFDAWWKRISTKSVFQHTPHSPQKFHSISALDFVRSVLNYVHQASIISDNTKCPIDQAKIQSVDCITQTFWDILLIASGDWMDFSSWYWYCGILHPFNCWTVDRATFACWLSNSQLQSTVCNRAF